INRSAFPAKPEALPGHLHHDIGLHDIAFLNLVEAVKHKTALEARTDFLHVVLEALQARQFAFIDLISVSGNANLAVTLELSVQNVGTGNVSDCGCTEDLTDLRMAD